MNRLITLRLHVALLACAGLSLGSLASADTPSPAAATPATVPAEAAPPTPSASETAPAAAATPAPPAASTPAQAAAPPSGANATSEERGKHFKAEGYKVQTRNGQKLFCRVDADTGTHIPREHCYTEDALAKAEAKAPSNVTDLGNSSTRPAGLTPMPVSH